MNVYGYANNNSVKHTDPLGLATFACTPIASWTGLSREDVEANALDEGKWELRNAHAFMAMGGIPRTKIRFPIKWGANCYAVFVKSYEDIIRTYRRHYMLEYCAEETCDGYRHFVRLRDDEEFVGERKRQYRRVEDKRTTIIPIVVEFDAQPACFNWVMGLR